MIFKYAVKELNRHRIRTITNIFGFVIAVLFMILVFSVSKYYSQDAVKTLKNVGTHFIAFVPQTADCLSCYNDAGAFVEDVYTTLLDYKVLDEVKALPGVQDAAPYLLFKKFSYVYNTFVSIGGIDVNSKATQTNVCAEANLVKGRYLVADDKNSVIIEESFAELMKLDVGKYIQVFDRNFEIVGIINNGIRPAKANMYAPIKVVKEIIRSSWLNRCKLKLNGDFNMVLVEVSDARIQEKVMVSVKNVFKKNTNRDGNISSYNCYKPARNVIAVTENLALITSLIVLVMVLLFVLKSQLSSLTERIKEIGLLKAIGWTNINIISQILIESIIQGFAGGLIGSLISFIFVVKLVSWQTVLILSVAGMGVSILGAMGVGLVLSLLAVKLEPAEALRSF